MPFEKLPETISPVVVTKQPQPRRNKRGSSPVSPSRHSSCGRSLTSLLHGGDSAGWHRRLYAIAVLGAARRSIIRTINRSLPFYSGAVRVVMATTVTAPLERQFGNSAGLSQMDLHQLGGTSVIAAAVTLEPQHRRCRGKRCSRRSMRTSYLPRESAGRPRFTARRIPPTRRADAGHHFRFRPFARKWKIWWYAAGSKTIELNGVGLVSISGGQKPAVRIRANRWRCLRMHQSRGSRTALIQASVNAAKGNFDGPRAGLPDRLDDQLVSSADYRSVVVAYRNNAPVMLTDVAEIVA